MQKLTADSPAAKSADLVAANLATLRSLFPELLTETQDGPAVNLDVLKQLVGDRTVTDAEEKYGLNWHGKRRARQLALTPSTGTLRPCPEDSVEWDTTKNLMIEGDNLEVLKLLQKSYAGKVKLIYIDPPYNTGKDFVYPDDFQDNIANYQRLTGQIDAGGLKTSSNTEASGRFHTDWLNMMYPRLKLARNLLREDGVLLVSIDDSELSSVAKLCAEVFGEENGKTMLVWQKSNKPLNRSDDGFSSNTEYILVYSKSGVVSLKGIPISAEHLKAYRNPDDDPRGRWIQTPLFLRTNSNKPKELKLPWNGELRTEKWFVSQQTLDRLWSENRIWLGKDGASEVVYKKNFLSEKDSEGMVPTNLLLAEKVGFSRNGTEDFSALIPEVEFPHPKPVSLIRYLCEQTTNAGDVVLDFFAGSGTTGQALMEQNLTCGSYCRYILVQLPELLDLDDTAQAAAATYCDQLGKPRTIAELTKERLRRAGAKIRAEWEAKQKAAAEQADLLNPAPAAGERCAPDVGFRVFKLASSNIREWDPQRDRLAESLEASVDHLKTDRTEQDILYELLLKLGLDLCVPIETRAFTGHVVSSVGAGSLLVCLSPKIAAAEVETLALGIVAWHQELKPAGETTVVFRDSAFADDIAKTNLAAILQQHGLETVRSL
jgi:adenine-specific DNA-methyltransferase